MDAEQNVIWCATFQLAWDELKAATNTDVLPVSNAEEVSARLDASTLAWADLPAGSAYAAAGRPEAPLLQEIAETLRQRFPDFDIPDWVLQPSPLDAYVAFAALETQTVFDPPYLQHDAPLAFTAGDGVEHSLRAFGVYGEAAEAHRPMLDQVEVLFQHRPEGSMQMEAFALDLAKDQDVEVIVAVVKPGETLAATLEELDRQVAQFALLEGYERARRLELTDSFLVPEMNWRLHHNFEELEGLDRIVLAGDGAGFWIEEASQVIGFTLDRSGAALRSSATIVFAAIPRHFIVDRPFLVVLRLRGAEHPFFVMWVANAELLNKY